MFKKLIAVVKEEWAKAAPKEQTDLPRFDDGVPIVGDVIEMAKALFDDGKDAEALDLLHQCRNECGERDLISSVQTLSNENIGLRDRRAADALAPIVLAELQKHEDGILQTALYKILPDQSKELVRYACYRLTENGQIERVKKGRSYLLKLPSGPQ